MADCMNFPDTVEEFMEQYKIIDTEEVYTNGVELVPIFRTKQWFNCHSYNADVIPVVHGTWERHMSFGICDKCGYEYNWTGTDAKNYCPNCGAKME